MKEISNKVSPGSTSSKNLFLVVFAGMTLKLEKVGPIFFKSQSMTILAVHDKRRQETLSIPEYSLK